MATRTIDLAQLIQQAKATAESASTFPRYKLPVGEDKVLSVLESAYIGQVKSRGMKPNLDEETKKHLASVAKWLTDKDTKPSLLLYGGVGNGKTTMTKAIAVTIACLIDMAGKSLVNDSPAFWDDKEGERLLKSILRYPQLVLVTAQRLADLASSDVEGFNEYRGKTLLAIDDLGCEPTRVRNYGTEVTPVTDLIYQRYERCLPTIITTNLDRKDIRAQYGDRIADRFNELFELVAFTNKSYRR